VRKALQRAIWGLVVVAVAVTSYAAGGISGYLNTNPNRPVEALAYQVFGPPWRFVRDSIGSLTRTTPDVTAMNTNRFAVTSSASGLSGTVIFALRGNPLGYEDRIVEVDRTGRVVWEYRLQDGLKLIGEVRKLANGNVLFLKSTLPPPDGLLPTALHYVTEVDRQGNVVRQLEVAATHHAEVLPGGNLLLVDAARNLVSEVDPASGNTVWTWNALDHIQPYNAATYVGYTPEQFPNRAQRNMYVEFFEGNPLNRGWTHVNSAQRLGNGNTVLSLRNFDLIVEVDPSGDVVWSYGALVLKHQHCAWVLDNGHLLITDNGNARIIEVDRATQRIVWEYREGLKFAIQACAYRLPNGDTLITDSGNQRILEVDPDGKTVWELKVQVPETIPLYRAWWSP
jgi:outer membrane protein assembly factor BamB